MVRWLHGVRELGRIQADLDFSHLSNCTFTSFIALTLRSHLVTRLDKHVFGNTVNTTTSSASRPMLVMTRSRRLTVKSE